MDKSLALMTVFVAAFLKTLIKSPTFADVGVLLVIGGVLAYYEYKTNEKRIEAFAEKIKHYEADLENVKEKLNTVKFAQQAKSLTFGNKQ